jgi:hypothetical protein
LRAVTAMRHRRKWIAVLLLLAVFVGWPVVAHYRLKHKAAGYRRQLIAQGEKLTVAELTPVLPPDAENGAAGLLAAAAQFGTFNGTNQPPAMRIVAPGRALVAWRQAVLPTGDSTNIWPGLREEIAARRDALAAARAALARPALVMNLDYSQGFTLMLAHLAAFKRTAQFFSAAVVLDLHEGRISEAGDNLRGLTALASRYKDEPVVLSSLVRLALATIAVNTTWEALQAPDWTDEHLATLQADWAAMDFRSQAETALAMERAVTMNTIADLRTSPRAMTGFGAAGGGGSTSALKELWELGQGVLNDPGKGFKELVQRYPAYWAWKWWWSYEDELVQMQYIQAALTALREVGAEGFSAALDRCAQAGQKIRRAHPKAGAWFGFGFGEMAENYLARVRAAEIQRHLLVAAIALQRFHLRHGHYPETLAALVPEFCPEAPRDPVDGRPLRYRLDADGSFLLYSVGENGLDDGGDPSLPTSQKSRYWLKALDVVWPQPAAPQEIMLYQLAAEAEREKEQFRPRVIVTNDLSAAVRMELARLARTYHFTLTNAVAPKP